MGVLAIGAGQGRRQAEEDAHQSRDGQGRNVQQSEYMVGLPDGVRGL